MFFTTSNGFCFYNYHCYWWKYYHQIRWQSVCQRKGTTGQESFTRRLGQKKATGETLSFDHVTLDGDANVMKGHYCIIHGDRNKITGNWNEVWGHENVVRGDNNEVWGNDCDVKGVNCSLNGEKCPDEDYESAAEGRKSSRNIVGVDGDLHVGAGASSVVAVVTRFN